MKHGTAATYVSQKCRCQECKTANTVRQRERSRAKLFGKYESKFVDVAPVREHLESLVKRGWGTRTIALKSGVHRTQVTNVLYGRSGSDPRPTQLKQISRTNAEKLLALRFSLDVPGGVSVNARGAHRRMQALAAQGFSLAWQARQIGWSTQNYSQLLKRKTISAATFNKIKALFDEYELRKPMPETSQERAGVTRALNTARAFNWVSAAAWDDIDLDEAPPVVEVVSVVDEVVVDDLMAGFAVKVPWGSKSAYVAALLRRGASTGHIQQVLSCSGETIRNVQNSLNVL